MRRLRGWLKRCVTRRFLLIFELAMMAVVGATVLAMLR